MIYDELVTQYGDPQAISWEVTEVDLLLDAAQWYLSQLLIALLQVYLGIELVAP